MRTFTREQPLDDRVVAHDAVRHEFVEQNHLMQIRVGPERADGIQQLALLRGRGRQATQQHAVTLEHAQQMADALAASVQHAVEQHVELRLGRQVRGRRLQEGLERIGRVLGAYLGHQSGGERGFIVGVGRRWGIGASSLGGSRRLVLEDGLGAWRQQRHELGRHGSLDALVERQARTLLQHLGHEATLEGVQRLLRNRVPETRERQGCWLVRRSGSGATSSSSSRHRAYQPAQFHL